MSFFLGTALLAVVTAVACALPGAFVVLRKNSMLVDAIGHSVFPGIVVGYFFTRDLDSPLLILGAALAGLIVVLGSEWLARTGLLSGDAPQGLVFPALFSAGVILVTLNFGNVHLDTHAVLVGDLNLAAFEQLTVGGVHLGPRYLYVMLAVLLVDAAFIVAFLPQLTVSTFDPQFARTIGVRAGLLRPALRRRRRRRPPPRPRAGPQGAARGAHGGAPGGEGRPGLTAGPVAGFGARHRPGRGPRPGDPGLPESAAEGARAT